MQSLSWYYHRLRTMSLPEMVWRLRGRARGQIDRLAFASRQRPVALGSVIARSAQAVGGTRSAHAVLLKPSVLGAHLRDVDETLPVPVAWRERAVTCADKIADHRWTLFDLADHYLGPAIKWNYEYKADRATPLKFAESIDYRDYAAVGDCKFVWEPNRHHQLVTLGRAFRLTGDERYARCAVELLDSWIRQCPFGVGMNWRSPLELAVRLINWVWTLELIRPSAALTEAHAERLCAVAYRHLWDMDRKYSRYSSANNHVIGEAAGVLIGASYLSGFRDAPRWRARSRAILSREIIRQTYPDGGTREQALGYQLFVMQFFLLAGLVARNHGEDFPDAYWDRLQRMFDFVAALAECGGDPPMIGDADDGYVLDLGERLGHVPSLMAIGAVLFDRADFAAQAGAFGEPAFWLLGEEGRRRFDAMDVVRRSDGTGVDSARHECRGSGGESGSGVLRSRALADSGYYLLQSGSADAPDNVSVVFDCGDLGFGAIAAHGHADTLSFTLRVGGVDVLVDPGTYDYFSYGRWRRYFKSTRAHNTVVIDGRDQSESLGPFLWGRRAHTRCVQWSPNDHGGSVSGEHDGYTHLPDPVVHRRTVWLDAREQTVTVEDQIAADGEHEIGQYFHFAEHCRVTLTEGTGGQAASGIPCGGGQAAGGSVAVGNDGRAARGTTRLNVDFGAGSVSMELDPRMEVTVVQGREEPILGWVSRGYHRKVPSPTVFARCAGRGTLTLVTRMALRFAVADPVGSAGVGRTEERANS